MWGFLEALNRKFIGSLAVLLVLACDQISKIFAGFYFPITCNRGVALGIGLIGPFDIVLPLTFLIIILCFLVRETRIVNIVSLSIIFGGGLSNFADRLVIGCVRDFIPFGRFSSFNLADAAITVGVVVLVLNIRSWIPKVGR